MGELLYLLHPNVLMCEITLWLFWEGVQGIQWSMRAPLLGLMSPTGG